ncbi:MAG: hypothetical protein EOO88_14295, partial [Pedobacter sp.]
MKNIRTIAALFLLLSFSATESYSQSATKHLNAAQYQRLFPQHNSFYSYNAFIKAAAEMSNITVHIEMRDVYLFRITRIDAAKKQTEVVREDPEWKEPWAKAKTYRAFTIRFADFCNSKNPALNKREMAAFFAQAAHETRNGRDGSYT